MPRVIVNSTPLIVLSNINKLDLLKSLYKEIYIPQSVFDEVTAKADLVILDDNAAKKTAKFLGLKVTGTLGVILKSKRLGFVSNVTDIMTSLIDNGFYISPEIQRLVKIEAGE